MAGSEQEVYQQVRVVKVSDLVAESRGGPDDMDMRVYVRQNQDQEALTFDVTLWNLSKDTWWSISSGDGIRVELGWERGPISTVCLGIVTQKRTERDGDDVKFILSGKDITSMLLNLSFSKTWKNQSIDELVRDIAGDLGMTVANVDPVPGDFPSGRCRFWAIKDDKPITDWLDQLIAEAEERTDTKWTWRAEQGRLWFEEANQETTEAATLSYENTLVSFSESTGGGGGEAAPGGGGGGGAPGGGGGGGGEPSGAQYEFTAMCEPNITEGSIVWVETDEVTGAFKAIDIEQTSDSTDGTHETSGKLSQQLGYKPARPTGKELDEQRVKQHKDWLRRTGAL